MDESKNVRQAYRTVFKDLVLEAIEGIEALAIQPERPPVQAIGGMSSAHEESSFEFPQSPLMTGNLMVHTNSTYHLIDLYNSCSEPPNNTQKSDNITDIFFAGDRAGNHLWSPEKSRYLDDFIEERGLGRGGYGKVVVARNILDDRAYAIKMINFPGMHSRRFVRILREVKSLAALDHTNIVRYHSAWIEEYHPRHAHNNGPTLANDTSTQTPTFTATLEYYEKSINNNNNNNQKTNDRALTMYIQMELCQFTLADWINYRNKLLMEGELTARRELLSGNEGQEAAIALNAVHSSRFFVLGKDGKRGLNMYEIKRIFKHLVRGIAHIHAHGLIHRDLKPQNIFFHGDDHVPKIGDFGLVSDPTGRDFEDDPFIEEAMSDLNLNTTSGGEDTLYHSHYRSNSSSQMTSGLGTTTYAAPEQLSGGEYNEKSDIFSLGIVFFELIYPFGTQMERVSVLKELKERQQFPARFVRRFPKEAAFIWSCLAKDPSMRPSAWEILESELLDHDVDDLISKLAYENDTLRQMLILQESEANQLQELNEIQMDEIESLRRRLAELDPNYHY